MNHLQMNMFNYYAVISTMCLLKDNTEDDVVSVLINSVEDTHTHTNGNS